MAFALYGRPIPDPAPNIVCFCAMMAAIVAQRRGGKVSQYVRECADFMEDVVGYKLSINDALPDDYDWSHAGAVEAAEALMEYDDP